MPSAAPDGLSCGPWSTRRNAERALAGTLKPFADLLDEAFAAIDECVSRLDGLDDAPSGRVIALVLIKGRNLALGCYSLSLDALAQEAGALFRPFIETVELLTYFRLDPNRIHEALEDRLPRAGEIARRIGAGLQQLREHLNAHASHLSVSEHSMRHLIDLSAGRLRPIQTFNEAVLRENLRTLLASVVWLMAAGVNCFTIVQVDQALIDVADGIRTRAFLLVDASR